MGLCRLREEHASIRQLVEGLAGGAAVRTDLRDLVLAHFAFEEEVLFTFLDAHLPRGTGPLSVVREEHETLRPLLEALGSGAPAPEDLERLATLLIAHLEKEEELILPFAHTVLVPEQLAKLGCQEHLDGQSRSIQDE